MSECSMLRIKIKINDKIDVRYIPIEWLKSAIKSDKTLEITIWGNKNEN